MKVIAYGIKLWSINSDLYPEFVKLYKSGKVDYLELLYVPGKSDNIEILIKNKIPIVVHAPNFSQNIFFGNTQLKENNKIIEETFYFSQKLNADGVIIHPDIGKKGNFIRFLKANKDKKLIIENMPKTALNGSFCLGYDIDDMAEFLSIGNFDFCLDVGHAIKSAFSQKIDYKKLLQSFIKLKPRIIHICDGYLNTEKDEHLSLGNGDFDLNFIAELIKKSEIKKLTFEVPKLYGLNNDIKNIEFFKSIIHKL